MARKRVGFQGTAGAYSELAVRRYFGNGTGIQSYQDFSSVFRAVVRGELDFGVLPLENSLTGSIHQNYDLLLKHRVWICGEVKLRIEHRLLAKKKSKLSEIKTVYSHPQALEQCSSYLAGLKKVEPFPYFDTAGAARLVAENEDRSIAAIAGPQAVVDYKLKVLKTGIEDNRENFTRFIVIGPISEQQRRRKRKGKTKYKTSVLFALKNIPGALYKSLSIFAIRDIDLLKIESRPIPGSPWKYIFYLDFEGQYSDERTTKALAHLEEITAFLKVLGSYEGAP